MQTFSGGQDVGESKSVSESKGVSESRDAYLCGIGYFYQESRGQRQRRQHYSM